MNFTKPTPIRSRKILEAAKDEPCTWPGCNKNDSTTVAAHSDMMIHGRGFSKKSDDIYVSFLCHEHHYLYDFGSELNRDEKEWHFMRAMSKTWKRLVEKGVIKIA